MSETRDGWVRMASYDTRENKKHGNPGESYRLLLAAAKRREIDVMSVVGVRGYLVKEVEADEYLKRHAEKKWNDAGPRQQPAAEPQGDAVQYEAMRTLQRIETALLRIAEAVEAMATRPG
jgi:hypothetical protein